MVIAARDGASSGQTPKQPNTVLVFADRQHKSVCRFCTGRKEVKQIIGDLDTAMLLEFESQRFERQSR